MSSPQQPNSAIPKPLPEDDDDVSWALQTAAVQWQRGAYQDALVWLRRAAESAVELSKWSRAADLNATATRLEKQLSKGGPASLPAQSQAPSAPPRNAMLPSFPVQTPVAASRTPGMGQFSTSSPRSTGGIGSLPPLSSAGFTSRPPSGRSSVVIDVEESELELSDEEIRELESDTGSADIPNGARPSAAALPAYSAPPSERGSSLPAFELESSRPLPNPLPPRQSALGPARTTANQTPAQSGTLPSFALEQSARMPAVAASEAPPRASSGLPSFPLETTASTVPPVSKWPRLGSAGTSHLPPSPALPSFESAAPSRSFADDGDDGAPGIDEASVEPPVFEERISDADLLQELEPLEVEPVRSEAPNASEPPSNQLDLVELQVPPSTRGTPVRTMSGLGHLAVRPGNVSSRPRASSAPLPPALPEGRVSTKPLLVRGAERPPPVPPPAPSVTGRPPSVPRLTPTGSIEPRMPKRTLSYASPLDFGSKPPSQRPSTGPTEAAPSSQRPSTGPTEAAPSKRATSNAPTVRKMEIAEPVSGLPPPSARSLEPEDLPTVSSPSLSRPPPAYAAASDGDGILEDGSRGAAPLSVGDADARIVAPATVEPRSEPAGYGAPISTSPPGERRRINFRFEERAQAEQPPSEAPPDTDRSKPSSHEAPPLQVPATFEEEPLAVLPPVTTRSSAGPASSSSDDVYLSGVRLADVRGLADLPPSAHRVLAEKARIEALAAGEEASFFSVALVLEGWVGLMPAIADCACATAVVGEVVFTEGTLSDGIMLRVVAGQDEVVVATWDSEAIAEATKECPWVADDLRLLADGFQALAGACLGPLGDRLDDSLRSIVTSRCEIRTLLPGEQLCAAGKPVPGMHIIGGGSIELVDENARVAKSYGTGEFLFAPQVLAGGVAPYSARAGSKGALVLFAPRMAAHELLVSVPPLLEILAD